MNTNPRNESPDWTRQHHAFRHLDGSLPQAAARKQPKRRHGVQSWYAPRRSNDPLTGVVLGAIAAAALFIAALSVAGLLP